MVALRAPENTSKYVRWLACDIVVERDSHMLLTLLSQVIAILLIIGMFPIAQQICGSKRE